MARKYIISVFVLILISSFIYAQEDYRSRIAIVPMENGTGMDQYNPLCNTITETVSLVLEFLKDYRVLDDQDANLGLLGNTNSLVEMREAAVSEKIDEVIYGRAVVTDGVFEFTLSLYNVNEGKVTNQQSVEAYSVLEVFDAADELTEGLIGQLSDIHIAFGSVKLVQKGGKGNYTVNLDGFPLRNPDKTFRKVLNGTYEISITQERLTGPAVIFKENIQVAEDEETLVEFSIPPGLPGEFTLLDKKGEALLALGDSEDTFDEFLEGITAFQNQTLALEYDPELEGLRDNYLAQAGGIASTVLQARMEAADDSFYRKRPRFSETLGSYEDISELVKTQFEVKKLVSSKELIISEPQKVQIGEDGNVYFNCFDIGKENTLVAWNPERNAVAVRILDGKTESYTGDFITNRRRVYLWEPGTAKVEILDGNLNTLETISVPDLPTGPENLKLAVSAKGLLYMASGSLVRVIDTTRQYDDDGNLLPPDRYRAIEEKLLEQIKTTRQPPMDIFFDKARHLNLFFPGASRILVLDENGILLKDLALEMCHPLSRIAVDRLGFYYVTLNEENTIAKYTPKGEFITLYGEYGTEDGQFSIPTGIAVSEEGLLYIADSYNARMQSLNPLTPPVLYPEIAQYGEDLDRRIERTEMAVKKERTARQEITLGKHALNFLGSGLLLASTGALAFTADTAGANAAYAYYTYENSTDADEISDARGTVEGEQLFHQIAEIGSMTTLGFSAGILTTTLLDIGLDSTVTRYNRKQAQTMDMNVLYESDPDKYRSIRTSSRIGVWTGIMPPVLGLCTTIGFWSNNNFEKDILMGLTAAGIGIPPLFSHLHGGRFSIGLFTAGLAADALAFLAMAGFDDAVDFDSWDYDKYAGYDSDPQPDASGGAEFEMDRMIDRVSDLSSFYLLAAAYGIRLSAGIFDARYGWTYTNNYNRYKAVKQVEDERLSKVDWTVNPFLNQEGALGMALSLNF